MHCPACSSPAAQQITPWLLRCEACGLYRSMLTAGPGAAFAGLDELRRSNFQLLLDRLERLRPLRGARILEIGCGRGLFLKAGQSRGARMTGVEPVEADAAKALADGYDVQIGLFPQCPADQGPYDLVVFNDVFEHLPNPVEAMLAVERLLARDGHAVVNIPSSRGMIFRIASVLRRIGLPGPYDRLWQRGLPSPHLFYYAPDSLQRLVERHTQMRLVESSSLPSVSRSGLADRLDSQGVGIPPWLLKPAVTALSYMLPMLPADIHVAVFARGSRFTHDLPAASRQRETLAAVGSG